MGWGDPALTGSDEAGGFALPAGTVAFLLTDVEGSTRAWETEPDAMAAAMDSHNAILDAAVSAHGGVCPPAQGEGDSIVAAFARPSDAVLAARDAQVALVAEEWPTSTPLRVRMAVHAGEARFIDDGNYAGQAIIRTARLRAITHGGQVLVSAAARDLTVDHLGDGVAFRDLGEHRLRDLARPERVYQLEGTGLLDDFAPLRSLDAHPHNLPVQLSTFIGRVAEIATVAGLLASNRLVTIAGAGGAGKTRLAQHVAAEVLDRFDDGVWWVELAEVVDSAVIAATISTVVGVKGEIGDGALDALAERLGDRRALLVLDNCEHLVAPVAALVDHVLRRCPGIVVLATSREPLEVGGEIAWRIPPLGIPIENGRTPIAALPQFDSVRLFVERARGVRPNFHLSDDNGPAIAGICTRLDGIPLALELAAARCRSLSPERIHAGLTDVFHLLTGGGRTALPRQQTLEASIAWSHDLLAPEEQTLLRRLAVFNGGCTLDDAEAVVADETLDAGAVLDLLDRLVAQSLVHLDDNDTIPRYRQLETVRQYATRRLDEAGEGDELRARHADRFVSIAEEIGVAVEGADELAGYARVVAERDNFAAALDCLAADEQWADYARLVLGLAWARMITDPVQGSRDLSAALDHLPVGSPTTARLLAARAMSRAYNVDVSAASLDGNAALLVADANGDERSVGRAKLAMGFALMFIEPLAAADMLAAALEHSGRASDRFGEVYATVSRATGTIDARGDMVAGWEQIHQAEEAAHDLGGTYLTAYVHAAAAVALCVQGRFPEASERVDKAERSLSEFGRAVRLPDAYLVRTSFAGNMIAHTRTWLGLALVKPFDLEETALLVEAARVEGQLFVFFGVGSMMAAAHAALGEPERGRAEAAVIAETMKAVGADFWIGIGGVFEAADRHAMGDVVAARHLLRANEELVERCGCIYQLARVHHRAGAFAIFEGKIAEAERRAHECLSLARTHDYGSEGSLALELLAAVAAATSSPVEGVRLAAAAARIRGDRAIYGRGAGDGERLNAALALCRDALGDEAYEAAWVEGYALSLAEAVEYAQRARGERKRPTLGWESLTPTERLVVEHVEAGLTNPQIAEELLISPETVKTHLSHVFTKLGIKSRSELAAAATRWAGDHDSQHPVRPAAPR